MYQVKITASGGGDTYEFGPPVATLVECTAIAETLEWIFQKRCELHEDVPWPNWFPAIDYYEGCDLYAEDEKGEMWSYGGEDSDAKGVWEIVTWRLPQ